MSRKVIVIGMVLALAVLVGSPARASGSCCSGQAENGNVIQGALQFGGNLWNGLADKKGI